MDNELKAILCNCAKNRWPQKFRVNKGKIITTLGNIYDMPNDPMDLSNLIHDIMIGNERVLKNNKPPPSSVRKNSTNRLDLDIYGYACSEAIRLGKSQEYIDLLFSCIHTALYLGYIAEHDIVYKDGRIVSVKGINIEVPVIVKNGSK